MMERPATVALVDIRMPGHDGAWLIERLQKSHPGTAIVIITGIVDLDPRLTLRPGVVGYLTKPFESAQVFELTGKHAFTTVGELSANHHLLGMQVRWAQPIVGDALGLGRHRFVGDRLHLVDAILERVEARTPAQRIDRAEAAGRHQPRARVLRHAVQRPSLERRAKRIVQPLLGEVEVAEEPDQRGQDATPLVAERLVDVYHSATGRTSTAPPIRAAGTREASSIAASRSSAS